MTVFVGGVFVGGVFVATICGLSIGGIFADRIGFEATFLISTGLAAVSGLLVYVMLDGTVKVWIAAEDEALRGAVYTGDQEAVQRRGDHQATSRPGHRRPARCALRRRVARLLLAIRTVPESGHRHWSGEKRRGIRR